MERKIRFSIRMSEGKDVMRGIEKCLRYWGSELELCSLGV